MHSINSKRSLIWRIIRWLTLEMYIYLQNCCCGANLNSTAKNAWGMQIWASQQLTTHITFLFMWDETASILTIKPLPMEIMWTTTKQNWALKLMRDSVPCTNACLIVCIYVWNTECYWITEIIYLGPLFKDHLCGQGMHDWSLQYQM